MLKNRFFIITFLVSLVSTQLMFWAIYLNYGLLPPEIPLYYFKPWGQERLGAPSELWYLPACVGGVFVLNTVLAWRLYRSEKYLAKLLVLTAAGVCVLGLLFLLRILNLVLP